jgi:hypothetical protein
MKPHRRALIGAAATCALLVPAATASAQNVLFKDDAEGAIDANWLVGEAPAGNEPWQKSDSDTPKYRPNASHEGAASYWAGAAQPWDPVNPSPGDVVMTLKNPLVVPADGKTTVAFWSLFQNEGDDAGLVEAAVVTDGGKPAWKKVAAVKLDPNTAGGPYVRNYCDPTHPAETAAEEFEEIKGDLGAYAGKKIMLRWNLKYGNENRSATQPCGWWVDDIAITTTGTPGNVGAAPTTPPPAPPAAAPSKPSVKLGGLRAKGKRSTLTLTVSGSAIKKAVLTLYKGKKKIGTAKVSQLAPGTRRVKFKTKVKLPRVNKKPYGVKIAGKASDGSAFKFSGKTRDR